MQATSEATAEIGHNQEPTEFDRLAERREALLDNARRWLTERPEFTDKEMADKAEDFIKQLRAFNKEVEEQRKAEKKPHDDAAKAVQAKYKGFTDGTLSALDAFNKKKTDYLKKLEQIRLDEERKAREEADKKARLAREAAERAAQEADSEDALDASIEAQQLQRDAEQSQAEAEAIASSKPKLQGNFGNASGLRKHYSAKVTDHQACLAFFSDRQEVRELIQKLANAHAKSPASRNIPVPGMEIIVEERA